MCLFPFRIAPTVILFFFLVLSASSVPAVFFLENAQAGTIALSTQIEMAMVDSNLLVKISVSNQGDEAAFNVFPELRIGPVTKTFTKLGQIDSSENHYWAVRIRDSELDFQKNGSYPVYVLMQYQDANQYRFSMPEMIILNYRSPNVKGTVSGNIGIKMEKGAGEAIVKLTSHAAHSFSGKLTLFLPVELESRPQSMSVALAPSERRKAHVFKVRNLSALEGSQYKMFAVLEFNHGDKHGVIILSDVISIHSDKGRYAAASVVYGLLTIGILFVALVLKEGAPVLISHSFKKATPND